MRCDCLFTMYALPEVVSVVVITSTNQCYGSSGRSSQVFSRIDCILFVLVFNRARSFFPLDSSHQFERCNLGKTYHPSHSSCLTDSVFKDERNASSAHLLRDQDPSVSGTSLYYNILHFISGTLLQLDNMQPCAAKTCPSPIATSTERHE